MKLPSFSISSELKELSKFESLDRSECSIVFYAEDEYSMSHFELILNELVNNFGMKVCYVTSSKTDPILQSKNEKILSFFIGEGLARTKFFLNLQADILIMTMPDLDTYHIKRSKVHNVHYIYIFHSLVSTHLIYRKGAFDHYDTIFCVGNHQIEEIRSTESKYDLRPKNLFKHGYGRLDKLLSEFLNKKEIETINAKKRQVLIAPSWGKHGLLETIGEEVVEVLLNYGYKVIVRPHPMTEKKSGKVIKKLENKFKENTNFTLEKDIRLSESFYSSDCMISDWSGVALDYSFSLERPVLFVDVPKKIKNPDFEDIPNLPLEIGIRSKIGDIISVKDLESLPLKIELLCNNSTHFKEQIQKIKEETVFNVGKSGIMGAKYIIHLLNEIHKGKIN